VSRVRENRMPGSMRRREETGTSRAHTCRTVVAPPADPTATGFGEDDGFQREAALWAATRRECSWGFDLLRRSDALAAEAVAQSQRYAAMAILPLAWCPSMWATASAAWLSG
jgi:hypothetical protein